MNLEGEKNSPAIPGLSYIGSNHNLSHSRRRSLEHLRGVRDKNEARLQLLEEKKMVTREKLTCVWLTVGMRECKGMMTNRSGKTEEQKQPDSKCFGWHWALVLVVQAAQSRLSTTMAIRSICSVQKADSPFIYPTIVKKYPIHLNSDPLPSYFI